MGIIKNVFLTGASGYLGSNLLLRLVQEGYSVSILLRRSSKITRIESVLEKITIFYTDDFDIDTCFTNKHYDAIIHTAASYGRSSNELIEVLEPNLLLPLKLLQVAIKNGVTLFVNTDTSLPRALNSYALSKKQFNDWLQFYSDKIAIINIELEYFYGSGDDSWKFVNNVIHKFLTKASSIDFTEATQERDFIYIDDVVDAYLLLLEQKSIFSSFSNIELGSGEVYLLKNLILILQELCLGEATKLNFGAIPTRNNEIMHSVADIGILRDLGWHPKYSLESGLKITIDNEKINIYGTD